jgi:acetyl-CoA acetyltransferase
MSTNGNRTFVIGVGMTKFDKPGTKDGDYPDWAKEAGEKALADAGIPYTDVEQASPTTRSSRPTRATATATRPTASARSTSSASPEFRS